MLQLTDTAQQDDPMGTTMTRKVLLADISAAKALAERLARLQKISQHDTKEESEAWRVVHGFADLEKMFGDFSDEHLPRIMNATTTEDDLEDVLVEVAEDFRHMLYHMRDSRFFRLYIED